ncbi:MAG: ribonuclease HII, partial [Lachnospiraceae bacterium]|nr:ribonuclease HII [Lachnospiraceae bacterium]
MAKRTAEEEKLRLEGMKAFEKEYRACGLIAGIDEAGRGPLAGPVVAAAVILPEDAFLMYLDDSKKVTEKRREVLFDQIRETAVSYGIGMASPERIDEINILQATYEAMREAIAALDPIPAVLLND